MSNKKNFEGYKLPVNPSSERGTLAQGFATPSQDRTPQIQNIPPRRALPVIFLPGIMGSNLRMSTDRQQNLGQKNNLAWRPSHKLASYNMANDTASERQRRLDPATTEVDTYDPLKNPTGDPDETSDERNGEIEFGQVYHPMSDINGGLPLLVGDHPRTMGKGGKTAGQKARERGWGEVLFDSYSTLLLRCEKSLNSPFIRGRVSGHWINVIDVLPSTWNAHTPLRPLDESTLRSAVKGVWFPVHAMGYNWLLGNRESGIAVARRIVALIENYNKQGFQCEKVILMTHSMGGLVARAVIHPQMGNLTDKVLGVVHGVMPATGAGAAYKRMRCGFEGDDTAAEVVGDTGELVTAVLGNAQGGLELLPSQDYGNNWLQVKHNRTTLKSLPMNGDPYEEIYKLKDKWYGLLNENLLNPAGLRNGPSLKKTHVLLDRAKDFHSKIKSTYHDQSYAHYGADPDRAAWHKVVWAIDNPAKIEDVDLLRLVADSSQGTVTLVDARRPLSAERAGLEFVAKLLPAAEPGDQTVPLHSADHQLKSGKFKGIFRQRGYEHQNSYKDVAALNSTLYSLARIASTMVWAK